MDISTRTGRRMGVCSVWRAFYFFTRLPPQLTPSVGIVPHCYSSTLRRGPIAGALIG